jgi:hypothetical protein
VYEVSEGSDLTPERCRELDDTFFESNPIAVWRSRIDSLMVDSAPAAAGSVLAEEIVSLGLNPLMLQVGVPDQPDRETQRALDAFTLRHHLAESLVRLVCAVLEVEQGGGNSVWAQIATGEHSGADLVKRVRELLGGPVPIGLFVPPTEVPPAVDTAPAELLEGVACTGRGSSMRSASWWATAWT